VKIGEKTAVLASVNRVLNENDYYLSTLPKPYMKRGIILALHSIALRDYSSFPLFLLEKVLEFFPLFLF